jgi:hypothetical protein
LIDRREIGGQDLVQQLNHSLLGFHRKPPPSSQGVIVINPRARRGHSIARSDMSPQWLLQGIINIGSDMVKCIVKYF